MQTNRVVAVLMLVAGGIVLLLGVGWGVAAMGEGTLSTSGFVLLMALVVILGGVLDGSGLLLLLRSQRESAELVDVNRQKLILNALQSRGQLSLSEAALEADVSLEQIKEDLYDLVGKGLFSGYIDWDDRILYARQARELRAAERCPNCGGDLKLAGKSVISCPYCGTDIFL